VKVFLSYGGLTDQVTALRLQALAAVNGLTAFVPPAYTRHMPGALLDPTVTPRINDADIVLCVIGSVLSEACRQEIDTALALQKPVIVMADPMSASRLQPYFGPNLVVVDPANPEAAERAIVEHLKLINAQASAKKALLALGTIALGLLIFAPQD
jgi:hypothetical protein